MEDTKVCKIVQQALSLRETYMRDVDQSFPELIKRKLHRSYKPTPPAVASTITDCNANNVIEDPWKCEKPTNLGYILQAKSGLTQVYKSDQDLKRNKSKSRYCVMECFVNFSPFSELYQVRSLGQFVADMDYLYRAATDGPLKSFCYRRLVYLTHKFELHILLNEMSELCEQRSNPHRDFYNIHKVDTHVHAASCMNRKHLLRFIKRTLKTQRNRTVCVDKQTGKEMTLGQVFDLLCGGSAYDLSVDWLNGHEDQEAVHEKYPTNKSHMRKIFLTTGNHIDGVYFADIIKQVAAELEKSKYQHAELR